MAPKIVRDNLQQIVVRAGQSVKLDVEIIGEPPPTCTWTFAGKPVDSESVKVENEEYMTHLNIKNGVRKQSGKYHITATNTSGKDEEDVEIIFLGNYLFSPRFFLVIVLKSNFFCMLF